MKKNVLVLGAAALIAGLPTAAATTGNDSEAATPTTPVQSSGSAEATSDPVQTVESATPTAPAAPAPLLVPVPIPGTGDDDEDEDEDDAMRTTDPLGKDTPAHPVLAA